MAMMEKIRAASEAASPAVAADEQVQLALAHLQALETFLNAADHFVNQLVLSEIAGNAGPQNQRDKHELARHAEIVLRYAQERVGQVRHLLDACSSALP